MVNEISLAIIAITMVTLVSSLIIVFVKLKKSIDILQADIHTLSVETTSLVVKLNEIATDIKRKSQSLNFLLSPLSFFNKDQEKSPGEIIPQAAEWIISSFVLIKKAKEFIKQYAK